MATAAVPKRLLDINHLKEVFQVLRKYHFTSTRYYELGLLLGLTDNTLKIIENDHRGDTARCLLECLNAWLRKADNVESEGDPSWYTLIAALRKIGDNAVAEGIAREKHVTCMDADDSEKHAACVIFARHQSQSLQALLPSLVILLHKEGITKEMLPATRETADLLKVVQEAVCVNHANLEKFAAILQLFPDTVSVGNAILKDYKKVFSDENTDGSASDREEERGGLLEIHIPRSLNPEFESMRAKFASTLQKVNKALTVSIEDLKSYCQLGYRYLQPQIATCHTTLDVLLVISQRCSLTNISILEGVVKHFNIEEARTAIEQYKKSIKKFCQAISLRLSLDEKLSSPSPLQCQTATFLVDRKVGDYTLSDIEDCTILAFEQLAPSVNAVVVRKNNSFTITCSFPLVLSESLIATALNNLDVLVQKKGLLQLTIGYSTVYSCTTHDETKMISDSKKMSSFESSTLYTEWVTAVYTSRGTLEQMLVSQTVQHAMDKNRQLLEEYMYIETLDIPEFETKQMQAMKLHVQIEQLQSFLQTKKATDSTVGKMNTRELSIFQATQMRWVNEKDHQIKELTQEVESLKKAIHDSPANPVGSVYGLNCPWGVALSDDGHVIVTECSGHCVTVLDRKLKKVKSFGGLGKSGNVKFMNPRGVAITQDNFILITDNYKMIQKIDMDGQFIMAVGRQGSGRLEFNAPAGIAVSPLTGDIYVADLCNHRVQVLNPDLTFSHEFGKLGSAEGEFKYPRHIAIDSKGLLYVADCNNHRIQKFTPKGEFLAQFGAKGSGRGQLAFPVGITVDTIEGHVYVTERDNHRVTVFTGDGQFVRSFRNGYQPRGITFSEGGLLYVCDYSNKSLVVY